LTLIDVEYTEAFEDCRAHDVTVTMHDSAVVEKYGWTAVPRKMSTLLEQSQASSGPAKPTCTSSIVVPDTALANEISDYAKAELPLQTFNHSMRAYY